MSKGNYINLLLILLTIPFREIHRLFCNNYSEVDVFLFEDKRIDIEWLIKDIGDGLANISIAYLLVRVIGRNRLIHTAALAYFWLQILSAVNYFLRMNTDGYFTLYIFFVLFYFVRFYKPTV